MATELIDISATAELFHVSTRTIRNWWQRGYIPAPVKIAGTLRWDRAELEACLSQLRLPSPWPEQRTQV